MFTCLSTFFIIKYYVGDEAMLDFIEGKIILISADYVTILVGGIGFKVFTPNPYSFEEESVVRVYLYNHIREDEYSLYGFKTLEERDMFLKLLNVKGLGPKVGMTILASSTIEGLIDAIDRENILYLQKFPKVGQKLARQIILDLKGKLVKKDTNEEVNNELIEALTTLGYKLPDIKRVCKDIDKDTPIESQIKEALKLLVR